MQSLAHYLRFIKFSHTVFAMPFALIGFFLGFMATGNPSDNIRSTLSFHEIFQLKKNDFFALLGLVVLCMVFARSAAMAFNRYLDRTYDALNPRTANREIPRGIITPRNALVFMILNAVLFIICTYFINRLCFWLSPVALAIVLGYSYTKRFTALSHVVLGLGLSLAPLGAFLALTAKFHWLPVFFSLAVLFWVAGFDIIYALQDEEFDKANKLYSIPALLGKHRALKISVFFHLLSMICLVAAGAAGHFGAFYWAGTFVFGALLIYQHALVKPQDVSKVNPAFMTTNGLASVIFAFFVILDIIL
ncbi:MAG: putative 4-hydroxybenzoate polyprenyltransferase [Chitinophagaceae bacterium]|nr:putative 4-hydroxybenzoate polyprenyltransferase [Chitinophagaceae bacterium]